MCPTGTPAIRSVSRTPVVRLHQHADTYGVFASVTRREAVPMPHLNSWQIMPVPPPTLPSATGPARAESSAAIDVLRPDMKTVDVVEVAVLCLGHDRQRPPVATRIRLALAHAPGDDGVTYDTDAVRVREHDGSLQSAAFVDPGRAGHLAIAVQREPARRTRDVERLLPRGRIAVTPVRTLCLVGELISVICRPSRRHVGDGIQRSWVAVEGNAEIAGAGSERPMPLRERKQSERDHQFHHVFYSGRTHTPCAVRRILQARQDK